MSPLTQDEILAKAKAAFQPDEPAAGAGAEPHDAGGEQQREEERPVEITHSKSILASGASGEEVLELATLLGALGFKTNSIAQGENPHNVLDTSVMADVRAFGDGAGIKEDRGIVEGERGNVPQLLGQFVGPRIWQALYDAVERL